MATANTEHAQDKRFAVELKDVDGALYDLRPSASIAVQVGARVARIEVHRVQPRNPDVLHAVLEELNFIEQRFEVELALPKRGWRALLANWWHRRRLKLLCQCVTALLRRVAGQQVVPIQYRDMPALAVQVARVKMSAIALIAIGEY
ncbi:hypothetical protein GO300_03820 [Ralstonia solanacearum]|nr:hypothetical protein [Ralstonia solanacearum]